jgi:hypothetical protein
MECINTSPKSIDNYMRKSAQFGYGRMGSWCNISFSGRAPTWCQPWRLVEATPRSGMQQHKSKIHWRLYEKKCPVRLWQNRPLVQHFVPWRCLKKVSAPMASCGQLRKWNATTQVQNPSKIIWKKVPNLSMVEQGPRATIQSLEVLSQGVRPVG